jgi:hypothetical protein
VVVGAVHRWGDGSVHGWILMRSNDALGPGLGVFVRDACVLSVRMVKAYLSTH